MTNKYLEDAVKNLDLLDAANQKKIAKSALCHMQDKEKAMENLSLLTALMPDTRGTGLSADINMVSIAILESAKAVETINMLPTSTDGVLQLVSRKVFADYYMEGWKYDPKILAQCLKTLSDQTSAVTKEDLLLLYSVRKSGHTRLEGMLWNLTCRSNVRDCCVSASRCCAGKRGSAEEFQECFEKSIEKFYILEQLPDDFDASEVSAGIAELPDILAQPGAMEIYQAGKHYCNHISLEKDRDYTEVGDIIRKTKERMSSLSSKTGFGWSDPEFVMEKYFDQASRIHFDRKLLSGYLQNISGFDKETLENSVLTEASFLAVCTGNRYLDLMTRIRTSADKTEQLSYLAIRCIKEHKNALLRLMDEKLDLFLHLSPKSILFDAQFWAFCNVNTLQEKDILTLLKKKKENGREYESFVYESTGVGYSYLSGLYTFHELSLLLLQPQWIRQIYAGLDPEMRVDEKLRRIRQIIHDDIEKNGLTENNCQDAGIALSRESFSDYCRRRNIKDVSRNSMFHLMVYEAGNEGISRLADEAVTGRDVNIILRNRNLPELYELGLEGFKTSFISLDADSKWLEEQITIPEEHMDNFQEFCLEGSASIVHDYYMHLGEEQRKNVLLLAKAEIYGLLEEVKYQNFQEEIGFLIPEEVKDEWKENTSITNGRIVTGEYTDFKNVMLIGERPGYTCMNYKKGEYKECLLATFDANKKVLYVKEDSEIIGRAIIRLTKCSDSKKETSGLHFADVGNENAGSDEKLVLFLERCYFNGFDGPKKERIYHSLYELAKKKAGQMGVELVLASDYGSIARKNNFLRESSYMYISKSKNGSQYLDSLGGNCEKGGRYVEGNFYFAS